MDLSDLFTERPIPGDDIWRVELVVFEFLQVDRPGTNAREARLIRGNSSKFLPNSCEIFPTPGLNDL